jgi:hypothetical protein
MIQELFQMLAHRRVLVHRGLLAVTAETHKQARQRRREQLAATAPALRALTAVWWAVSLPVAASLRMAAATLLAVVAVVGEKAAVLLLADVAEMLLAAVIVEPVAVLLTGASWRSRLVGWAT